MRAENHHCFPILDVSDVNLAFVLIGGGLPQTLTRLSVNGLKINIVSAIVARK
jgi:hypothetical protein